MADSDGPVMRTTLTEQVTARLRDAISNGTYPPGQLIPSESELIKQYGVSRPVVRAALDALRRQGLISTVNGVGSYAREHHPPHTITRTGADPWDELVPAGDGPTHRRDYADRPTAAFFGVAEGEMLFITEAPATSTHTGQKVITSRVILQSALEAIEPAPLPFEATRADLIDQLTRQHGPLTEAETVRAISADPDQAAALDLPTGTPLTQITRLTRTADDRTLMTETEITSGSTTQYLYIFPPAR